MDIDLDVIELSWDELICGRVEDDLIQSQSNMIIRWGGVSGTMSFPSPRSRLTLLFSRL
jgi:hypothetical protein